MKVVKYRDLNLIDFYLDKYLVVSCDSSGGIGDKDYDVIKVNPSLVGYYTAHVAVSELISIGANPILIVDTLSVEMKTGKKIIEGIKKIFDELGLAEENMITGSTEQNIPVKQTGLGITAIGELKKSKFSKIKTKKDSLIISIGNPKVGNEVIENNNNDILNIKTLSILRSKKYIQEIIPVGSKGILYECEVLAKINSLEFKLFKNKDINIYKSGGPSTCAILSIEEKYLELIKKDFKLPINLIGKVI